MKKNQKIFRATLFVCVACFLIGLMGIFGAQPAKASGSLSSFKINDGAEVRMAYNNEDKLDYTGTGIRYNISISAKEYEAIEAGSATFGILIAPFDYQTENELNKANVFGIGGNAKYYWATKDVDGNWKDFDGDKTDKKEIINLSTTKMVYDKDADVYRFYGSIVDILPGNEGREFIGVGYVQYDGDIAMVYGDTQRSMAYVAQKALEDSMNNFDETEINFLNESYCDKYLCEQCRNNRAEGERGNEDTSADALDVSKEHYARSDNESDDKDIPYRLSVHYLLDKVMSRADKVLGDESENSGEKEDRNYAKSQRKPL